VTIILDKQPKAAASWRENNKDYLLRYNRMYHDKNKEAIRERKRRYRSVNVEKIKAYRKKHYEENKDADRERNRARARAWYGLNREKVKNRNRAWFENTRPKRIAVRHLADPKHADELSALYAAGCSYCGSHERLEIDHKVPKSRGGTGARVNLQWLCKPCNRAKYAMTEEEFFRHIKLILRLRGDHS
jgi:5-methylcytosine-specific restriction endonuclease McrA